MLDHDRIDRLEIMHVEALKRIKRLENLLDAKRTDKQQSAPPVQEEVINKIYDAYPTRCPKRGANLGKGYKNRVKIKALIASGKFTGESLFEAQQAYIEDCTRNDQFMKAYATFLNNVPDPVEAVENAPTQTGLRFDY
jgi:hypothetical protein